MAKIRVLLADDHPLVRSGIKSTIMGEPDLVLVGEASDGDQVRQLCQELEFDVLLLDLSMPGPPPAETVAYLRENHPQLRVLALTAYDDDAYVRGLITAGAKGYVLKDEATAAVVRAIRAVYQGDMWFSHAIVEKLAQWKAQEPAPGPVLSSRERQLLQLIAQGLDNASIALELSLAEQTVRNYISQLYAKLEVSTRTEAALCAHKYGLID